MEKTSFDVQFVPILCSLSSNNMVQSATLLCRHKTRLIKSRIPGTF